jgi:hypothetical protein
VVIALATMPSFTAQKPPREHVRFELKAASKASGTIHWSISNQSAGAIFVYDFFLWGPALKVEDRANQVVFDTTPTEISKSCGPNHLAPVVLVVIGPGRTIQGDFSDDALRKVKADSVSMRIAVGGDPYSVVDEVRRLDSSRRCDEDPYNAIVRWGTIVESNPIRPTE